MNQLPVMLLLSALALLFISFLLNIDLRSRGVSAVKSWKLLAELWIAFICSGAIFAASNAMLGEVRRKNDITAETFQRIAQISDLTILQQGLILLGVLVSIALLVHFLWSLSKLRQQS